MARRFNGTSDYLEHGAAVVGAVPITMACWFKSSVNGGATRTLLAIGDSAASTRVILFHSTNGTLNASTADVAGSSSDAISVDDCIAGTWNHGCGVFASSTDRRAFLNGVKTTNATDRILGTPTKTTIGARYAGAVRGNYMAGAIADAAIWDVVLDDAEVYLLSRGYSPHLIRPGSLKAYWPLVGQFSPNEIDVKGRFDATVFGAKPAIADHPPMIPRTGRGRALDFAALLAALPAAVDMVPARRQAVHRAATH